MLGAKDVHGVNPSPISGSRRICLHPIRKRQYLVYEYNDVSLLQSHHFHSGEELENTLHRYVMLYNQQLPQSALGTKTPLQVMKDWHKLKPELFRKQPYHLPGCDT